MQFLSKLWKVAASFALLSTFVALLFLTQTRYDPEENNFKAQFVSALQFVDNHFYDWRSTRLIPSGAKYVDPDIVLVMIDDESLSKIGKFPFPRRIYARLLDRLTELGVKTVGFDILFPENSNPEDDRLFLEGLKRFRQDGREAILSYSLSKYGEDSTEEVPEFVYTQIVSGQLPKGTKPFYINRFTDPFPELAQTDTPLGYISNREDRDGVFRHYIIIANVDEITSAELPEDDERPANFAMPSFALSLYQAHTGNKVKVEIDKTGSTLMTVDKTAIPLDRSGAMRIRYSARLENYNGVPLWMLLSKVSKEDEKKLRQAFKGKVAFIGSNAEGAHDFRNSPIDPKMPGVLGHSNMLHMLLREKYYKDDVDNFFIALAMMLLGFAIIKLTMKRGNALLDLGSMILICTTMISIDRYLLLPDGYQVRLFFPLACAFFTYSWTTFINFQKTIREKRQIKGTFARYVSPAIVNEMLDNPEKLKIGGERKDITCLFSDARDFTSISESLSATELSSMLNEYMSRMTDIVFETKGTLDKYIGDAIVAIWGAPLDLPDHPELAVSAAVRMMEAMPAINEDFKARGLPELKVGIGLNSGECSVGNMGSDKVFSYTALGDNMNLGARLEGLCKYYGAQILISDFTNDRLPKGKFLTRPLDKVRVKGKNKPVQIIEVIHGAHPLKDDKETIDFYCQAYDLFSRKDFAQAKTVLEGILLAHPDDKPTGRLLKLCDKWMSEEAPEEFDVTNMKEK